MKTGPCCDKSAGQQGSSPQTRGWTLRIGFSSQFGFLVPADAGMAPLLVSWWVGSGRSSPRLRGWPGRAEQEGPGKIASPCTRRYTPDNAKAPDLAMFSLVRGLSLWGE